MPIKEWMLGLQGHNEVVTLDDVLLLVKGGALRPTDLVKKLGEPWRAANEIPELAPHFEAPGGKPPGVPKAEPPRETSNRPRPPERKTTARAEAKPSDSKPPPAEEKTDVQPVVVEKKPAEPPRPPTRKTPLELPKPPPKPTLEPMVEKYFSPVDLLRCASFSFEPRKLLLTLVLVAAVGLGVIPLHVLSRESEGWLEKVMLAGAVTLSVFGFAFICTALAYVTRRQIESRDWSLGEVIRWLGSNAKTAFVYPVVVLMPSLVAGGLLWLLGLLRNLGPGMASTLRFLYFIPMVLALLAVLGVLIYQLACMFVPAAAVMEGQGLTGAVSSAWNHVRRQWGRIVLHWLIVTVATGVITIVCATLAGWVITLPEWLFGVPEDPEILDSWFRGFSWLQRAYHGVSLALGMVLPASLFSTLGTLSYCSLRVAAAGQITTPPEETSGGMPDHTPARGAAESTQPGETHPAAPDATNPGKPL